MIRAKDDSEPGRISIETSLPGISPADMDISIVGNSLTIKGETQHEEEKEEKGRYHFQERRYGSSNAQSACRWK